MENAKVVMQKYRVLDAEVQAMEYTNANREYICQWLKGPSIQGTTIKVVSNGAIKDLNLGDWLIYNGTDWFVVVDEYFKEYYTPVEE